MKARDPIPPLNIKLDDVYSYIESLPDDHKKELYLDRLLKVHPKDKKYFEIDDSGSLLTIKEEEMRSFVGQLIGINFLGDESMIKSFGAKYSSIPKPADAATDEEKQIAQLERVLFLYDHIDFLEKLEREQELLPYAQKRLKKVTDAADSKTAHSYKIDQNLFPKSDPADLALGNLKTKTQLSDFVKNCESNIEKYKSEFTEFSQDPDSKTLSSSADIGISEKLPKPFSSQVVNYLNEAGKQALHVSGVSRESSPVNDPRWKRYSAVRDGMLGGMRNHPDLKSGIGFRKNYVKSNHEAGLISLSEFNALNKMIDEQEKSANEKHKKYIADLEKMIEATNRSILDKISKDVDVKDGLYQSKLLHFLIMSSVVFPIPLFDFIFEAFEPFLGGSLDLSEFLSSIFSVDGPFGNLAWVTDKMELDKLMTMTTDLFSGPLDLVNGLVQNDITTPIFESVGQGAAGSPLSGLILLGVAEAFTNVTQKSAENYYANKDILSDAIKAFEDKMVDIYKAQDKQVSTDNGAVLEKEFDIKENIFLASKAASWLQEKYNQNPKACEIFVKNILKDQAASASALAALKAGKKGDVLNKKLVEYFYGAIGGDLFQNVVMLRKAEEDPVIARKVGEIFGLDFSLAMLEKVKAKYPLKDNAGAETSIKKLDDLFDADGKLKDEFVFADGSLQNIPKLVEVVVAGKNNYYEIPVVADRADMERKLSDLRTISTLEETLKKEQLVNVKNAVADLKYDDIKQEMQKDFAIELVARHNKSNPQNMIGGLPQKIDQIFQAELKDNLINIVDYLNSPPQPPLVLEQYAILGDKLHKKVEDFNNVNGHLPNADEFKGLLSDDVVEEATNKMLLVVAMRRANIAAYYQLLEDSKDPNFDLNDFWKEECQPLGDMNAMIQSEKSLAKLQCFVMQEYMAENGGNEDEARKRFIQDICDGTKDVFSGDVNSDTQLSDIVFSRYHIEALQELAERIKFSHNSQSISITKDEYVKANLAMMPPSSMPSPLQCKQLMGLEQVQAQDPGITP